MLGDHEAGIMGTRMELELNGTLNDTISYELWAM